jgi:hypothetical protein
MRFGRGRGASLQWSRRHMTLISQLRIVTFHAAQTHVHFQFHAAQALPLIL